MKREASPSVPAPRHVKSFRQLIAARREPDRRRQQYSRRAPPCGERRIAVRALVGAEAVDHPGELGIVAVGCRAPRAGACSGGRFPRPRRCSHRCLGADAKPPREIRDRPQRLQRGRPHAALGGGASNAQVPCPARHRADLARMRAVAHHSELSGVDPWRCTRRPGRRGSWLHRSVIPASQRNGADRHCGKYRDDRVVPGERHPASVH